MSEFSAQELRLLDETAEVEIETTRSGSNSKRRTIIWVVVDGGGVYIRSVRGPEGAWYQAARQGGGARLLANEQAWPIRLEPVAGAAEIDRVSQAIQRKYTERWPGPTAAMLRPQVLPTTLRVRPEPAGEHR